MAVSLYRKYRSRSLDEIVGQKGVVRALKAAISSGSISHAYLFTGPRGVGKTSIARILAFEIIKQPYNIENLPVDIVEVDAASNRGIEEIRDLRDKVRIAPVNSPYKVYIIDEVHMLTTPAFNALLKTLEEPPAHVVFILATTESHKLPETIVSRTQRYNFSLASQNEVTEHLSTIAHKEKINIDRESLELIATHSGGSMRDALSTLDHVRHLSKNIRSDDIRLNIGLPSIEVVNGIIDAIASNDASSVLKKLEIAEQDNVAATSLSHNLGLTLKQNLQNSKNKLSLQQTTQLMHALARVESSNKPETQLIVALLDAINLDLPAAVKPKPNKISIPEQDTQKPKQQKQATPKQEDNKDLLASNKIELDSSNPTPQTPFNHEAWQEIVEDIRSTHNTLYSVLRMAQIDLKELGNKVLHINFKFPFHQKRINESKNKSIIKDKLSQKGYNFELVCGVLEDNDDTNLPIETTLPDKSTQSDELAKIQGVFGGAEAME